MNQVIVVVQATGATPHPRQPESGNRQRSCGAANVGILDPRCVTLFTHAMATAAFHACKLQKGVDARSAPVCPSLALTGEWRGLTLVGMIDEEKGPIVDRIVQRLAARFPEASKSLVLGIVREEYEALDQGRIRAYIPPLVEHSARSRLQREFARPHAES